MSHRLSKKERNDEQVVQLKDVNSFFGNLRNSSKYEDIWGNVTDDNRVWIGSRNGITFGRWDHNNPMVTAPKLLKERQYYVVTSRMGAGAGTVEIDVFISGYIGRFREGTMHWDADDTVTLARAWVDPRVRRCGVGRALADAVKTWAFAREAGLLETQVTENNDPAIRFYTSLGFADTGRREPLLSHPTLQIHFLHQVLRPSRSASRPPKCA